LTHATDQNEAEQGVQVLQQLIQEKESALAELRLQIASLTAELSRTRLLDQDRSRELQDIAVETRNELSALRNTVSVLRKEQEQLSNQLDFVYGSKGWYWTVKYTEWRKQGIIGLVKISLIVLRLLLVFPFWLAYRLIPELYHALVPSRVRISLWKYRQRALRRIRHGKASPRGTPATALSSHGHRSTLMPITVKDLRDIYIFAMVPYYDIGGGQRSAQLAKTFNRMGYAVHYIYAYSSTDGGDQDTHVPATRHMHVKDLTPADVVSHLRGEPIFIFESPHKDYLPYLELAKKIYAKVIYEHIDNWETSIGSFFYSTDTLTKFLRESDILVSTAHSLAERLADFMGRDPDLASRAGEIVYVPNAVDTDLFDPMRELARPTDLIQGTPTLLYFGSLWGEWFDWDLIRQVATECPCCAINLIGDYKPIESFARSMPANVHFLGLKVQAELPAYLAHCDFALLPFKNDEIGRYVSPLKIFEYIAMAKPVLATNLPDIQGYPSVYTSDSASEWVQVVRGETTVAGSASVGSFSFANNWYARCNLLLDHVESQPNDSPKHPTVSMIILNRNNRQVIERCVDSMLRYQKRYGYEVIIVDNASSDGSFEFLQQHYVDRIMLVRNSRNGCSSGRNLGIAHASGDLLLFVDSDQWAVSERWLDAPLAVLERQRHIGAVGWSGGWFDRDMVGGPTTTDVERNGIEPAQLYRTDIAYLASSGMLVRREVLRGDQSFDEAYDPTGYEDTDLSLQIRDQGFELAYCPYMNLNHQPHQTTHYGSASHWKLMDRNGAYFEHKWRKRNPRLLQYYLD
jgi:GT2 family glycosyltransferase/glycosyltransferase involved in cell wall biosynthesis